MAAGKYLWAIWDLEVHDWVRETNDGDRTAILVFLSLKDAKIRAARLWGYESYKAAWADGYCEVRKLGLLETKPCPTPS